MRWRKIVGWTAAILGVLVVVVIVGALLFLRTASFRSLAIRTIVDDVNRSTGGRAEIRNLDFQLSTLTAQLYDITIHGSEVVGQPALLHVDKLTVRVKIRSILQRQVNLSELLIEHPVAHVRIDRRRKSNIPQSPQKQSSSNTNVFELAAGHVLLTSGEINYNDASVPLDADLHDLRTEIHFDPLETRYRGSISYDNGRVRYGKEPTFPHSLEAKFSATPVQFSLESALLQIGSSAVSLRADVVDYSNPTADGRYDIRIHPQDFSTMMQPVATAGDVLLSGTMHYAGTGNQPLLRSISMDGEMAADGLAVSSSQGHIDLRRLQGHYQLSNGIFRARNVSFNALGGNISADVDVKNLDTTVSARVQTTIKGIS